MGSFRPARFLHCFLPSLLGYLSCRAACHRHGCHLCICVHHCVSAQGGQSYVIPCRPASIPLTIWLVATDVISQFAPSFHGFYRAIISTPFPWLLTEWHSISLNMSALFASAVVERLNNLLIESSRLTENDPEEAL